jgi:hypothetical protein
MRLCHDGQEGTMRARWLVLIGVGALAASLVGGPSSAAPPKKCPKGKVARVTDGKRACVPAARFRQRATPPPSATASLVQQTIAGGPITLRLKNGKPARPPLPKAVVNAVSRQYVAGEAQLITSVQEALTRTPNARSHELALTGATVSKSADGTSATGTIGFGGSASGHVISGKIEIGANASGQLNLGFDLTVADPTGATKSTGLTARDILKRGQECPGADGNLPVKGGHDVSSRSGETFGSKRVHLGTVRETTTSAATSGAQVKFGPDGKAQPFAFTVSATYDSSRSAQVLAFFSGRTRAVGSGTMTGTLDPATGKVSGATVTTNARTSGYGKGQAAADAEVRALMEKALNEEAGRLLKKVREAEKNCGGPYEVTLSLKTDSTFATHTASGTLNAKLTATKSTPGEFKGSVPVAYENVTYASTLGCTYHTIVGTGATFEATITVDPDGSLKVKWSAGDGSAGLSTSATIQCPPSPPDPPPPPIPGQPGPRLMMPAPTEFALPLTGGERAIGGGFQGGSDGWTHSGTITVKRVAP